MARSTVEAWLVEEQGSDVIRVVDQQSAIEQFATPEPMSSYTKTVPRSGTVDVAVVPKGSAYSEDAGTVDEIVLTARKFGRVVRLAEEDIADQLVATIDEKKRAWANSYAVAIDNACIGTTAASNGTTVPFESIYYKLTQADAAVGYTANANLMKTTTGVPLSYDNLSDLVALFESSPYFDEANALAIVHPLFKSALRKVKDANGNPIFVESAVAGTPSTVFGYPMKFSLGARTSTTNSSAPGGNRLFTIGNRQLLRLGKRSGPESVIIDGRDGASTLTDETLLKMRARRAFAVGDIRGWAALELVP